MHGNTTIETNNDLQAMLVSAYTYLNTPLSQRQKVARPGPGEKWYRDLKRNAVGKRCPTCNVRMRKKKYKNDPNAVTGEHIVPLNLGGDNKVNGAFPNCVPMCHGCNQARNKVVNTFNNSLNQKMGVVKFLIEQVYCRGVKLVEKYVKAFRRALKYQKSKKPMKSNPIGHVSFSKPPVVEKKTIVDSSQYDLALYSSVRELRHSFDQVWKNEEAVHVSHLHPSVRDRWFPEKPGMGRVQYRSKKKVRDWMDLYLSGKIGRHTFLNRFHSN